MISFKPLKMLLVERNMSKTDLRNLTGISKGTMSKISNDEYVSMLVIDKICNSLDCDISDVVMHCKENN